jgi:hypothetical protein
MSVEGGACSIVSAETNQPRVISLKQLPLRTYELIIIFFNLNLQ